MSRAVASDEGPAQDDGDPNGGLEPAASGQSELMLQRDCRYADDACQSWDGAQRDCEALSVLHFHGEVAAHDGSGELYAAIWQLVLE